MSTKQKNKKEKSRGGGGFIFSTLSFIIICAALVFGMSVFFRVSNIQVVGAARYTESEIAEASGIKNGDNLMFINREITAEKIYTKLIYVGEVKVSRKLPNTVVIDVSESGTVARIETDSGFWLIDKNCRLLEESSVEDDESHLKVLGISGVKPKKGETLNVSDEDKLKAQYLKDILTSIVGRSMIADVGSIDISNAANAEFSYKNRFKVKLGKNENIDYKLEMLLGVAAELEPEETGTIDLSQSKKAQFSPY
ncbi:MAG: cell division protein FtsQ/DivIB [Oscillospiraceae bacterium]|jgi:cell division protein FtsQ